MLLLLIGPAQERNAGLNACLRRNSHLYQLDQTVSGSFKHFKVGRLVRLARSEIYTKGFKTLTIVSSLHFGPFRTTPSSDPA